MGTPLSEIYDVFMSRITDYRLIDLFNSSETNFENYLQAWLEYAIVDFDVCNQDLNYDNTTKLFPEVLTRQNKIILATLMAKYWLSKEVADVTQFRLHITDRDFKVASEGQNLREKSAYLITVKEDCSQMLNSYAYKNNDWSEWINNQNFAGL
jgi:hypothetical protein